MKRIDRRLQALEAAEWDRRHAAEDVALGQLTDGELAHLLGFLRSMERTGTPIELGTASSAEALPWCSASELAAAKRYERLYFDAYEGVQR